MVSSGKFSGIEIISRFKIWISQKPFHWLLGGEKWISLFFLFLMSAFGENVAISAPNSGLSTSLRVMGLLHHQKAGRGRAAWKALEQIQILRCKEASWWRAAVDLKTHRLPCLGILPPMVILPPTEASPPLSTPRPSAGTLLMCRYIYNIIK